MQHAGPATGFYSSAYGEEEEEPSRGPLVLVAGAVAFVIFFLVVASTPGGGSSGETRKTYSFGTANPTAEHLLNLPTSEQAAILAQDAGEGCVGTEAFYMGISAEHEAFFSVRCSNGRSYAVMVFPDAGGSSKIQECSELSAIAHVQCFQKLPPP
jgi:hypothetical protein